MNSDNWANANKLYYNEILIIDIFIFGFSQKCGNLTVV